MFDPALQGGYQESQQGDKTLQIYNPTVGKYDVSVNVGPSYSTKRQEAAETQMQMVQAAPNLMPLVGDIMISNMDWPGADRIAERLKAMLPPQIKELENKPNENTLEAKAAQLQQAEAMMMQKAEKIFQKEQEMQLNEQALQEVGQNTAAERKELKALKVELDQLKVEVTAERRILSAERATVAAQLKLMQSEAGAKMYEADKKHESEIVKAAASVAQAAMANRGPESGIDQV
jgi:hypothetical protein